MGVLRHADRALSPRTISKVLTAMDINVNKFILKKTLKRMTKRKLIRTKKRLFVLTKKGKKVRRSKILKNLLNALEQQIENSETGCVASLINKPEAAELWNNVLMTR